MGQAFKMARVAEVFFVFLKLGLTSFGGPVAHLGYFRKELVERRGWLAEEQFGELLAICQFLPGPASSQLGFSLGLLRAGWLGAVAAFVGFTLPSALALMMFASFVPVLSGELAAAAVHGLKIVAFVVVADAVFGMSKKFCPDWTRRVIAMLAVVVLLAGASASMQLVVVGGSALIGVGYYFFGRPISSSVASLVGAPQGNAVLFELRYGVRFASALLLLFALLLVGLSMLASADSGLLSVADAFYQAGALVFGGGHVVLPLLEDAVVATNWVSSETFLSGYGAAQAIPGPMFAFSAYLGKLISTGQDAWVGALVALLFMFLPGFLLVSAALPFWRIIATSPAAASAMTAVNAAVVGLLAAALYDPIFVSAMNSPFDLAIGLVGLALLIVWRWSALAVVAWCVLASIVCAGLAG
jgi:chromate transporter